MENTFGMEGLSSEVHSISKQDPDSPSPNHPLLLATGHSLEVFCCYFSGHYNQNLDKNYSVIEI